MKIYLSAISSLKDPLESGVVIPSDFYALESFYSLSEWERAYIPRFKGFLLDSGAFTFMNAASKHGNVDWLSYADRFADFIKDNHITQYFELDIDSIKGIGYVEMLRNRIEARSGVQSIPVWHKCRGKDYYEGMCRDYKYVAIGGIVSKDMPIDLYERMFPWLISVAHINGAKIHGLGYTNTKKLSRFHFDSIDSTTWIVGAKFGETFYQKDGALLREVKRKSGKKMRCIDPRRLNLYNFQIWSNYAKYAENNL